MVSDFSIEGNLSFIPDKNEAVFRINKAVTNGFESHVGNKTNYRLINNQMANMLRPHIFLPFVRNEEILLTYLLCDWGSPATVSIPYVNGIHGDIFISH